MEAVVYESVPQFFYRNYKECVIIKANEITMEERYEEFFIKRKKMG